MFEESLIALLGDEADPVAAGWKLRELTENATDHGGELAKETADQAALLSKSDPAIVGASFTPRP